MVRNDERERVRVRGGEKGCGNACGKLYVHLRGIRAIHARTGTREGKGGWVITENGNARVNDWKARSRDSR